MNWRRQKERPGPPPCAEDRCRRAATDHLTGFSWKGDRPEVTVCAAHVRRYERAWGQVTSRPVEIASGRGWHGVKPPRGGWRAAA